jgi:hypothetical protein
MSRDAIFGDINRKVLQFLELHSVASRGNVAFMSFFALVAVFESVERRSNSRRCRRCERVAAARWLQLSKRG